MVIRLQGVVDNGLRRDVETVPPNTAQAIAFAQGEDVEVRVAVVNPAGFPYRPDPDSGDSRVVLTVKKQPGDLPALISVEGVWDDSQTNVATLIISAAASKYIPFGRYIYDVWLLNDVTGDVNQIIALSPLSLLPSVRWAP
jgi:hypothetical protein